MEIPNELKNAIDKQVARLKYSQLLVDVQQLSVNYHANRGQGRRLLSSESEAVAYAVTRMPATYGAVFSALGYAWQFSEMSIESLLDVGAGTGAASWAAATQLDLKTIKCVEREDAMIRIGKEMMAHGNRPLADATWEKKDIAHSVIGDKADLVISSYALNELHDSQRIPTLNMLWNCANRVFLLVEPGTPVGYQQIITARDYLLKKGAHVLAPCPHENKCPLTGNEWCHFTCRIARSKLHRLLKSGEAPFEDEKYAYMAFSRDECKHAASRVFRHPQIGKGTINLEICAEGGIEKYTCTKKEGEIFRIARKIKCGDSLPGVTPMKHS